MRLTARQSEALRFINSYSLTVEQLTAIDNLITEVSEKQGLSRPQAVAKVWAIAKRLQVQQSA